MIVPLFIIIIIIIIFQYMVMTSAVFLLHAWHVDMQDHCQKLMWKVTGDVGDTVHRKCASFNTDHSLSLKNYFTQSLQMINLGPYHVSLEDKDFLKYVYNSRVECF
jgi:hypothetical protein